MNYQAIDDAEITETDIVFNCPHCGKSLVIEYRGAGLTVPCSDCGKTVDVPIPEGMELDDLDMSAEDQQLQVIRQREALSDAQSRMLILEGHVDQLKRELEKKELARVKMSNGLKNASREVEVIGRAVDQISDALKRLTSELEKEDTPSREADIS